MSLRFFLHSPSHLTPTVTFRDPTTGIKCDINVNERLGLYNSDLIASYCDIYPPLRSMLFNIKSWAKPLGLNNQALGSFSSYCLVMMTIAFLQLKGVLPNLQTNLDDARPLNFWVAKPVETLCDCRFWTAPETGWSSRDVSQSDLLREWFRQVVLVHRWSP